ncbi:Uncharacterized protein dnl_37610 [Desulfonema limicola]|uniref:Uncharacterized protein n=1 Tax=Desulfonema limicola TaxID=45656 RepID=A0A975B9X2_9BACT|nr:Uncharacterized protein dnl_37610 [Desulfonema limicola]
MPGKPFKIYAQAPDNENQSAVPVKISFTLTNCHSAHVISPFYYFHFFSF